jgi:hypothetical protein
MRFLYTDNIRWHFFDLLMKLPPKSAARYSRFFLPTYFYSETRLLDVYSFGAIEMEQLREQLDKLRQKREALNVRTSGTATEKVPQPVEYQAVEDYCRKVSRGLDLLERDFDDRQKFLRSIVDKVVLEYGQATIMGALPRPPMEFSIVGAAPTSKNDYWGTVLPAAASEPPKLPEPCHTLDVGTLQSRGRNPILRFELVASI